MSVSRVFRNHLLSALVVAQVVFFMLPGESEAIPAFSRQTSQSCSTCHAQHFPTLNSFGRMFKANGYIMMGGQKQVESKDVSLPESLNFALVGTLQYIKNDEGTEIGFPTSLSLYAGGRMSRNSGFLLELPFEKTEVESTDSMGEEIEGESHSSLANYGSLKWNYVTQFKGINVGANVYSSEGSGPAYGYELLSTGAMGMSVAIGGVNAMGAIGLHKEHGITLMNQFGGGHGGPGAATGYGVSAQTNSWFVYTSQYYNKQMIERVKDPVFANYLRAAWTPTFGSFNLGMGVQIYSGQTRTNSGATVDANAFTADFQAQGSVAKMPLGIYASYAKAPKSSSSRENWYNGSDEGDNSAYSLLGELGVTDDFILALGYVDATYNSHANGEMKGISTIVGLNYMLAANQRLEVKYVDIGGDFNDASTAITLQIGF